MAKSRGKEPVVPTRAAMERIARQTQRLERGHFNAGPGRRQPPVLGGQSLILATDTGSGAVASGTGEATISGGGGTVGYTNPYSHSAVPSHAVMFLTRSAGGYLAVVWDCAGS